jgi:hypothetical protein
MQVMQVAMPDEVYAECGFETHTMAVDNFVNVYDLRVRGMDEDFGRLPGEEGVAERLAEAEESRRRGDKWITFDEMKAHLDSLFDR